MIFDYKGNRFPCQCESKMQKEKEEKLYFNESGESENEYWNIDAYLESAAIPSTYNQKNPYKETKVTTHFTINVFENNKLETFY